MDRNSIRCACAFLCALLTVPGQTFAQTGSGGQGGEFLRYGVGARALAMGRAYTALANDASAVYWNPAGIGTLSQWHLAAMHSNLFADSRYQYLAVAGPIISSKRTINHHVGIGMVSLSSDGFEARNAANSITGEFNTGDFAILLPYAVNFVNSWGSMSLGVKPQFFSQEVNDISGNGFGLDIGFVWQPLSPRFLKFVPLKSLMAWRLGINYRALSSLTLVNEEQDYPNSLNIGVSNVAFEDIIDAAVPGEPLSEWPVKIALAYEFEKIFQSKRPAEHHLGTEVSVRLSQSLVASGRVGYHFGRTSLEDNLTFGFGFKTDGPMWDNAPVVRGLAVDFANTTHPQLGNAYQVYLTARLGQWQRDVEGGRGRFGDLSDAELLAVLSEYTEDDRVIAERDSIDTLYKDEVAWQLSARADADGFLRKRYDDFIRGLSLVYKHAQAEFKRIRECHEKIPLFTDSSRRNDDCGLRTSRLDSIKRAYETFASDMRQERNHVYLFDYMKVLLLLGGAENNRKVVAICGESTLNSTFSSGDRVRARIFQQLAEKRPDKIVELLPLVSNDTLRVVLQLTDAVARLQPTDASKFDDGHVGIENVRSALRKLRQSRIALVKPLRANYLTTPFICDGVLEDDVRFVELAASVPELSAVEVRDRLIEILLALPHTDIAKGLSTRRRHLSDLASLSDDAARAEFIATYWQPYRQRFMENYAIDKDVFAVAPLSEETTRK